MMRSSGWVVSREQFGKQIFLLRIDYWRVVSHISIVIGSNIRFLFVSSELFFEGPNGKASSVITASSGLQAPINIGHVNHAPG